MATDLPPQGASGLPPDPPPDPPPGAQPGNPAGAPPGPLTGPTPAAGSSTSQTAAPAPPSYSDKLKVNVNRCERLKRNVLEISLDVEQGLKMKVEESDVAKTLAKIGIDIGSDMEGCQICPGFSRKIFVWLKPSCNIQRFCKDECYKVSEGVKTSLIKPMDKTEVAVLIKGLNLNTPDSIVKEYLNKHGKVVNDKVIYETEKEGPFKGLKNGNRRYLVDFSAGINLGSFHILDGANIQISYSGQYRTCARCHKTSRECPGGGIARTCESNHGPKIKLIDHMRSHWQAINFDPNLFSLPEGDDNKLEDVPIKTNFSFTPPGKQHENAPTKNNITAVVVKNLPEGLPETDAIEFLKSKGLDDEASAALKIHHNKKNTNIDIENITNSVAQILITNLNEKVFFNKKVYCRALLAVNSPENRANDTKSSDKNDGDASPSLKPSIPGLTTNQEHRSAERKKKKEAKKIANQKKREEIDKNSTSVMDLSRSDFLKENVITEFEYTDSSEDEDIAAGFNWSKSPLDALDPNSLLAAKKIQKEQIWLQQANSSQNNTFKRPLTSPTEAPSRSRARSVCQSQF